MASDSWHSGPDCGTGPSISQGTADGGLNAPSGLSPAVFLGGHDSGTSNGFHDTVLVGLAAIQNIIDWLAQVIGVYFLTVLEAGGPRSRFQRGGFLMRAFSLACHLLAMSSHRGESEQALWCLL